MANGEVNRGYLHGTSTIHIPAPSLDEQQQQLKISFTKFKHDDIVGLLFEALLQQTVVVIGPLFTLDELSHFVGCCGVSCLA